MHVDHSIAERFLASLSNMQCYELGIQPCACEGLDLLLLVVRQKKRLLVDDIGLRERRPEGLLLGVKHLGGQVGG